MRKKTREEFIKEAVIIHGNNYDYRNVAYLGTHVKVQIWCCLHKKYFWQTPHHHLLGSGCAKCGVLKQGNSLSDTTQSFIEKAIAIHGNNYLYDKVSYSRANNPVIIICSVHGEFVQTPHAHLNGHGCPACGNVKRLDTPSFIERANLIHDGKYDYSATNFVRSTDKVKITCLEHGCFEQEANSHLQGIGCPKCVSTISKIETEWLDYLNVPICFRTASIKINDRLLRVDAYIPQVHIVYEFYGDFWHGNPLFYPSQNINPRNGYSYGELYARTLERENMIRSTGYELVSIWEHEFKKIRRKL